MTGTMAIEQDDVGAQNQSMPIMVSLADGEVETCVPHAACHMPQRISTDVLGNLY